MIINIEYNEQELRRLVLNDLKNKLGEVDFLETDVSVLVKSKQNYKSEWEEASFKAVLRKID